MLLTGGSCHCQYTFQSRYTLIHCVWVQPYPSPSTTTCSSIMICLRACIDVCFSVLAFMLCYTQDDANTEGTVWLFSLLSISVFLYKQFAYLVLVVTTWIFSFLASFCSFIVQVKYYIGSSYHTWKKSLWYIWRIMINMTTIVSVYVVTAWRWPASRQPQPLTPLHF